jgi:hypothetical protein
MAKRLNADVIKLDQAGMGPGYGDLAKVAPNLCSWLCDATYEDGAKKGRSRLQVERKGDRVGLVLKDGDSGLCVEVHHESLTDALLTLELLLGHDDCPWALDPFPLMQSGKKRKK